VITVKNKVAPPLHKSELRSVFDFGFEGAVAGL
jgi:hypothetical protein